MAFVEDLSAFFTDFAVTVTVGAVSVSAIFDREYVEGMGGFGGGADSSIPVCVMRSTDVTANQIAAGNVIRLPQSAQSWFGNPAFGGSTSYTVRSVRHDGTGMCVLGLERA